MAELFRFRCFRCQKLLGASPSRIGSVVHCPRCRAELIVPPPLEAEPGDNPARGDDPDGGPIRLDDLGLRLDPEPHRKPAPGPAPDAGPSPLDYLESLADEPDPDPTADPEADPEPDDPPALPESPGPIHTAPTPSALGRRRRPARREPVARARDVILPRTVVVAWSLFVLLALAFAFAAGLLIGHYQWK